MSYPSNGRSTDGMSDDDEPLQQVRTIVPFGAIQLGLTVVFAFFFCLGGWAAFAPLDGAVVGIGALTVHGNSKTIQHHEGGVISALLVQEGDHVNQGQILIKLDDTQAMAMLHVHQAQLAGDEALCARDIAELSGADHIAFPIGANEQNLVNKASALRERVVFEAHKVLLEQQLRVLDERIVQSSRQQEGAIAQHDAAMRGLGFGVQQLSALVSLQKSGLAGRNTILELSRAVEALRGETGQLQSEISRHGAEVAELKAEKLRLHASAQGDATRELREAQLRINDVTPRIMVDRDLLSRLEIRAPVSGRVVDLQVFTTGGVIEPGRPIMQLVPDTRIIVAMAEIRPEDIGHIRSGQTARVVATGFNTRNTQAIDGHVEVVSADRISDPRTGRTYYTAEVSLLSDAAHEALLSRLKPGMPVEVTVWVESRTALEYLVEPLTRSFSSAGREM